MTHTHQRQNVIRIFAAYVIKSLYIKRPSVLMNVFLSYMIPLMAMQMCEPWYYFKYQQMYIKRKLESEGPPFREQNGV